MRIRRSTSGCARLSQKNCGLGIIDRAGAIAEPVRAADTYLLGASYVIDLGPRLTLTPSATIVNSGRHTVFSSATPLSILPGSSRWDAGATLADKEGRRSATLNCDNCTNETVIRTVFAELPYYQDPRIWTLTFRMNF